MGLCPPSLKVKFASSCLSRIPTLHFSALRSDRCRPGDPPRQSQPSPFPPVLAGQAEVHLFDATSASWEEEMTTNNFIKAIHSFDHSMNVGEHFRNFLTLAYCAYAKTVSSPERAEILEAEYMRVVVTYQDKDDVRRMPELIAMVFEGVHANSDFLGSVSSELNVLDGKAGQFFTPYEVSRLMAEINLSNVAETIEAKGYFTIQEPACGAGGMILAAADVLDRLGFDPTTTMWVEAIDVASMCQKMAYLQCTLRGLSGRVHHANTLTLDNYQSDVLKDSVLFLEQHGDPFDAEPENNIQKKVEQLSNPLGQLSLF